MGKRVGRLPRMAGRMEGWSLGDQGGVSMFFRNTHLPQGCRNPSLGLANQGNGLQGCKSRRRPESHLTCSWECKECKECEGMNPHTPKWTPIVRVGIPNGFPNLQSAITGVKTHRIKKTFVGLKSYWNLNV
jgi:hypothetical protein